MVNLNFVFITSDVIYQISGIRFDHFFLGVIEIVSDSKPKIIHRKILKLNRSSNGKFSNCHVHHLWTTINVSSFIKTEKLLSILWRHKYWKKFLRCRNGSFQQNLVIYSGMPKNCMCTCTQMFVYCSSIYYSLHLMY